MVGSVSTRKKDFNNCLLEVLAIINFFVYFCPSFVVKRGMDFFVAKSIAVSAHIASCYQMDMVGDMVGAGR